MSALRTADIVGSIGVNLHMRYTDSKYVNLTNVINDLSYLGLNLVRDYAPNYSDTSESTRYQMKALNKLADLGVKFNFLTGRDPAAVVKDIATFEGNHRGSVIAIEGPNEINNWAIKYDGLTGTAAATAYMNALATSAGAFSVLDDVSLYGLTGAGASVTASVNAAADVANVHMYPLQGNQAGSYIASIASKKALYGDKPIVLTEAGYYTPLKNNYGSAPTTVAWGGVDQETQAKLTLNMIFDATKYGLKEIYLYQLLDAYADPSGVSVDKNLGLFDVNNKPKIVATAIHNLTSILKDDGAEASSFKPSELAFTVSGLPTSGSTLTAQKSNGATDIVLWAEPDIWDQVAFKSIDVAATPTKIDFGSNHVSISVFDPMQSDKALATYADVTSITVDVKDHPLIIEVVDTPDPIKSESSADFAAGKSQFDIMRSLENYDSSSGAVIDAPQPIGMTSTVAVSKTTKMTNAFADFVGNGNHDKVIGTSEDNVIFGEGGNDSLYGGDGNDRLYGGAGNDKLFGEGGVNVLSGGDGNDTLYAGAQGDIMFGGAGSDTLKGGAGDDHFFGGTGRDLLYGGGGSNTYHFSPGDSLSSQRTGMDIIFGWTKDDHIEAGVAGVFEKFATSSSSSHSAALKHAEWVFANTGANILATQVKNDVVIFVDNDPTHKGAELSFVLDQTNLSQVDYSMFI
ncbi:calcium-binding protein [Sphingomonas crocodyli]|uniref:Calcium-binding protein n=1 Tax=Sphingomonas crocodyli TaxID=1979270 RepID=A0A437LXT7_9SPHN|nr:calcium-binding protein [Sphingomonas crocodyli]RVT90182.1 calcium-binding protein [Sphingomonas crocodyli]